MTLSDQELVDILADHPPKAHEPLPKGVGHVSNMWHALRRLGAEAYEGFPAATDSPTNASLLRMHEIAKSLQNDKAP